jgi:hypothetical protein
MSKLDRRQFVKDALGKLLQVAGTIVVASAAPIVAKAQGHESQSAQDPAEDVQGRADRLAANGNCPGEDAAALNEFLNGAFRNTPVGGFRNTPFGGFRNTPLGGFRNTPLGGFRNTPLSTFGNGGWPNGGWGGFHNGGWPNLGWRNW